MRTARRWSTTPLLATFAGSVFLIIFAVVAVISMSGQSKSSVAVEVHGEIKICHVADFHAAVERRADKVGKQYYTKCANSKFSLSKVTAIKKILNDNCDLSFFTGDLMHGGDYDLLEADGAMLPDPLRPPKPHGIARQLLPYWGIDAWSPGNHDLSDAVSLRPLISPEQPPMICSNLKSRIGNVLPYKKFKLNNSIQATVCVFGIVNPELVDQAPDLFQASDPLTSLEDAFQDSLHDGCGEPGTLIILLSHSGWDNDMNLIKRVQESPKAPRINIVLGGHTHNLIPVNYPWIVEDTALSHIGAYGGWVGVISMQSTAIGSNRRYKYTPWSANGIVSASKIWRLSEADSRRIATRYRIVRKQLSAKRSLQTDLILAQSTLQDESEHGVLLRALQPPPPPQGNNSNISDYIPIGYNSFKQLCIQDHELLQNARNQLKDIVSNLTAQHVANLPLKVNEKSIDCRRGQCVIGRWLAQTVMLAPTAVAKIAIHCPVASLLPSPSEQAWGGGDGDQSASKSEVEPPPSTTPSSEESPEGSTTLKAVNTVLGAVQAGIIRSAIPPDCESHFEYLAGGCQLRNPSTHLDLYDIERMLPFHNQLRVIIISNLDHLCDMVNQITRGWLEHNGSYPGVTHFGNLRYFINPKHYLFKNSAAKARQPFFDELWTLNDSEKLGIEVRNLQGQSVRGVCKGDTLAEVVDGADSVGDQTEARVLGDSASAVASPGSRWICLDEDVSCKASVGKILIVSTDILMAGADGEIIKWHEYADKDFLRSVVTKLIPEDNSLGCWLDGLKDFSVNDAAALFLNASVALL